LARYIRFYIDIPVAVILIVLIVVFREQVVNQLIVPVGNLLHVDMGEATVGANVIVNVVSDIIAAIVITVAVWFIYRTTLRNAASGRFLSFNVLADPQNPGETIEEEWGVATILFHPFSLNKNGVRVKIRIEHKDIILEGSGLMINNRFLVAHYTEVGKIQRRRSGSLFYTLDGEGDVWHGKYQYIDPIEGLPKIGEAVWRRKADQET